MKKLNCVPGDLCRIIQPGPFQDKLLIVTEMYLGQDSEPLWFYEGQLLLHNGRCQISFFDRVLRPIRDTDGQDETLTWQVKEIA